MKDVLFVQGAGRNVHAEWDLELVEDGVAYDTRKLLDSVRGRYGEY